MYRSNLIDISLYAELVSENRAVREAALRRINKSGGLVSPPDEKEMSLAQLHGATLLCLRGQRVIGFNRQVFDASQVGACFCSEFKLDPEQYFEHPEDLPNWEAADVADNAKSLRCVQWADRDAAHFAWRAATGYAGKQSAEGLVWALDTAVHPDFQRLGIGGTMRQRLREHHPPGVLNVAFRVFELRGVNGKPLSINNNPSTAAFTGSDTRLYAWTEEEIRITDGISLSVRWNQWLRRYPEAVAT